MKSLIVFLVGICLVSAQEPFRCKSPPNWHARIMREVMEDQRREFLQGSIAYDEPNERFRIIDEELTHDGSFRDASAHYFFHKEGYELRVNFTTKQCEKTALNESFHPFGVPDDARLVAAAEIGTNAGNVPGKCTGVEVDIWEGETREGGKYNSVVTKEDCVSVEESYFNRQYFFAERTSYYDVELGENPDDFKPPEFCN